MNDPMPYELDAPNDYKWTLEAYNRLLNETLIADVLHTEGVRTASVSGKCPRCNHEVNFAQVLDAISGEQAGVLGGEVATASADRYVGISVECRCGGEHPGRPKTAANGCGINFNIEIEVG
jgi:hypothetical protein